MPAIITKDGVTLTITTDAGPVALPWWEWTTIYFELVRPFEVKGMEHRFTVRAGGAYESGQIDIEVRCDKAAEWTTIDNIAWSPDSIVDTRHFPRAICQQIRYAIFVDICEGEKAICDRYAAACMRVVDEDARSDHHPAVRERDAVAQTLRALRDRFGRGTLARRIEAEIRLAGTSLPANVLIEEVMGQPGGPRDGSDVLAEIERLSAPGFEDEGCLNRIPGRAPGQSMLIDDPKPDMFDMPYEAPSEVEARKNKKANDLTREFAAERLAMDRAILATEERKAREAAEGYEAPTHLAPVIWSPGWKGYRSAKCGTDPFIATGSIHESTLGTGAWSVSGGNASTPSTIAEDEAAAVWQLEQRLRAEVARMVSVAAPKPAIGIDIMSTEAPAS